MRRDMGTALEYKHKNHPQQTERQGQNQEPLPIVAVIPDLVFDPLRGWTLVVARSVIEEIRTWNHTPLIVPVHDDKGEIDTAAHSYARTFCVSIYASPNLKELLDDVSHLHAIRAYNSRLYSARHEISPITDSGLGEDDGDVRDFFNPRVMVVPDLKDGVIRLSRRFIDALRLGAKVIPVIASDAEHLDDDMLAADASGILVPGSNSDYHPSHYGDEAEKPDHFYDHARDALVKASVEKAHAEDIPLFGICSGLQGIALFGDEQAGLIQNLDAQGIEGHNPFKANNMRASFHAARTPLEGAGERPVALPLDGDIKAGKFMAERFVSAHGVSFTPGSFFTHLLSMHFLLKAANQNPIREGFTIPVNSLHRQAVDPDKLTGKLSIDGVSEDGMVEAVHSRSHTYIVGVQFHPEAAFMHDVPKLHPLEKTLYRALFWSFGQAAVGKIWRDIIGRRGRTGAWRNRGMCRAYVTVPGSIKRTPEFVTNGGHMGTVFELTPKLE
jgi:gamma-glutamyl-gamma-aminobutyrate hydrolase PuuD